MGFSRATKMQAKGRVAFVGPPGSGKTWDALTWATAIAPNGRIALIDTENASASKYADLFTFDTLVLESFSPRSYIAAIEEAEAGGYEVLIIDSLSHAWVGRDGVLAMVDNATARSTSKNAFTSGWREVTPEHNALVEALVRCKCHLIVTMRSKTDYVIEEINGRKIPRKVGLAPVQREGLEYEFDLVAEIDCEHKMIVTKSRCSKLADGVWNKPDTKPATIFRDWLSDGAAVPTRTPAPSRSPNGNGATVPADPTSFGEYGDLMDDDRFEEAVMNELKRRSFTDDDCTEAKAQACRMKNVAGLGAFPMKSRHEFLTAIRAGFMDQYKQQPTEPKQTTRRPARAAAGK
jgi:hypothetical protein